MPPSLDQLLPPELMTFAAEQFPNLVMPIAVLVVGWLGALLLSAVVRGAIRRTRLDERIARRVVGEERAGEVDGARWAGKVVYYIALLFVLLAFLQSLQLTAATEPIQALLEAIFAFLPRIAGAALILFAAWLLATLSRRVIAHAMETWDVDGRIDEEAGTTHRRSLSGPLADTAYWLILLLFMPAVLGILELRGLLEPVQAMVDEFLAFVPNLFSAALMLGVGWLVARVVQRLVTNVLAGSGLDHLGERVGLARIVGKQTLSGLVGVVVYALVLIPVFIGALNALQLSAVTAPLSKMLETFFTALPALFGAALLLGVAYVGGRILAGVVQRVLAGIGFDNVLTRIGLAEVENEDRTPSALAGGLAMVAVIYFAAMEAARMLGFDTLAGLAANFAMLGGRVLLGLVVFGIGMYLANLAATAVARSAVNQAGTLSVLARVSILVLVGAIALGQVGIADRIIELAFGIGFGAVAVAAALAFGLGGRDSASRVIEDMRRHWQQERGSGSR